jgi:hypothetical protein
VADPSFADRRLAARKLEMALSNLNSARGWLEEIGRDLSETLHANR